MPQAFSFEEARKPDWLLQREKVRGRCLGLSYVLDLIGLNYFSSTVAPASSS